MSIADVEYPKPKESVMRYRLMVKRGGQWFSGVEVEDQNLAVTKCKNTLYECYVWDTWLNKTVFSNW